MAKTSIKNYVIAGIVGATIIAVFIWAYVLADFNYDIEGIDTSELSDYGDFEGITNQVNESVQAVADTNVDSGLFDVIGGLLVKALSTIKAFISSISFMTNAVSNMFGSFFYIPSPIKIAVVLIIGVSIGGVLLFKIIAGREDEY